MVLIVSHSARITLPASGAKYGFSGFPRRLVSRYCTAASVAASAGSPRARTLFRGAQHAWESLPPGIRG